MIDDTEICSYHTLLAVTLPPRRFVRSMAQLPILVFPDPRLRRQAEPVTQFDAGLTELVSDMFETMYAAPGIGLAATQVDVHRRLAVIDVSEEKNQPLVLVNPEILDRSGEETMEEGCLSIPEITEKVTRAECIRVRAANAEGQVREFDADGLLAVCIQHEIDHLDGKLFIDYLSPLKRNMIRRRIEKAQRRGQRRG